MPYEIKLKNGSADLKKIFGALVSFATIWRPKKLKWGAFLTMLRVKVVICKLLANDGHACFAYPTIHSVSILESYTKAIGKLFVTLIFNQKPFNNHSGSEKDF